MLLPLKLLLFAHIILSLNCSPLLSLNCSYWRSRVNCFPQKNKSLNLVRRLVHYYYSGLKHAIGFINFGFSIQVWDNARQCHQSQGLLTFILIYALVLLRCISHGVYISQVVLPDGDVVKTASRARKSAAGYASLFLLI